jgi:hypothetical protein
MASKHPPGDPMSPGNMRRLGVRRLVAYCLNSSSRHEGLATEPNGKLSR